MTKADQISFLREITRGMAAEGMSQLSDPELVQHALTARDATSFEVMVRRHGPMVYRTCWRVLQRQQDAEDAFQATFLVLSQKLHTVRKQASLAGWLHRVAHRISLRSRASAAIRRRHESQASKNECAMGNDPTWAELRTVLDAELETLPEKWRLPLLLCYLEGCTQDEAAERLQWTKISLRRRLEEGRRALSLRLTRRGFALSTVFAGILLSDSVIEAALFNRLVSATVETACATLVGSAAAVSPVVAAMTEKAAALSAPALKLISVVAVGVIVVGTSIGAILCTTQAGEQPPVPQQAQQRQAAKDSVKPGDKPGRANDNPDALPPGGILRLGTNRFDHGNHVRRLVPSSNGRHAVSVGWFGEAKLWDIETGRELPLAGGTLRDGVKTPEIDTITAIGPVDKSIGLLVTRDRGETELVDAITGKVLAAVQPRLSWPFAQSGFPAIRPDGAAVAYTTHDPISPTEKRFRVRVWDLAAAKWSAVYEPPAGRQRRVQSLLFSDNGKRLAIEYAEGKGIDVIDAERGSLLFAAEDINGEQEDRSAFSPDGKLFANVAPAEKPRAGLRKDILRIWDVATGKQHPPIKPERDALGLMVRFSPDGKRLVYLTVTKKRAFHVYDLALRKTVQDIPAVGQAGLYSDLTYLPDGKQLLTAEGSHLFVRDAVTGKVTSEQGPGHTAHVLHVAWSPDRNTLATAANSPDNRGLVWDASRGQILFPLAGNAARITALAYSPDGKLLATVGDDSTLRLHSAFDGKLLESCKTEVPSIKSLMFTPDGKHVISTGREMLHVWDIVQKKGRTVAQPFSYPLSVQPIPGGKAIIAGLLPQPGSRFNNVTTDPRLLATIDLSTGKEAAPRVELGLAIFLGFSPDGRFFVATETVDAPVGLHDTKTGRCLRLIGNTEERDGNMSLSVATFSTDGRSVALGYANGAVHVVEIASGGIRVAFQQEADVRSLAFSTDGSKLATAGGRWAMVWNLAGPSAARPASVEAAWAALADMDASKGFAAIQYLVSRRDSVQSIRERLKPIPEADAEHVARWIEQLGSNKFTERSVASKRLLETAESARPQLFDAARKTGSIEVRRRLEVILDTVAGDRALTGERLRSTRAVEVLERIRSAEAIVVLHSLAKGAPDALLTQGAIAALRRLETRR